MNKKKMIIKVVLLILLLAVIGFEVFFLFKDNDKNLNNGSDSDKQGEVANNENSKYLTDITTPYNKNGLKYQIHKESEYIYYYTISGLKDTELEKKINDSIVEKFNNLKKKAGNVEFDYFVSQVQASFENVLSVSFYLTYAKGEGENVDYYDSINIDLTTGEALTLEDVVLDMSVLRTAVTDYAYDYAYRSAGFLCGGGGLCIHPNPDYSGVEDTALKIAQKFNNGEYSFYFTPESVVLNFEDVSIFNPEELYFGDGGDHTCHKLLDYEDEETGEKYYTTYCDFYDSSISVPVYYYDYVDNVIIYEKFKSDENIFKNDLEVVPRKLIDKEAYGNGSESFYANYFIEKDSVLFDYAVDVGDWDSSERGIADDLEEGVVEELQKLNKGEFDVYYLTGLASSLGEYYYVGFDVLHYSMSKEEYLEIKKDIYLNKVNGNRISFNPGYIYISDQGYDFLKDKKPEKEFVFYIYDEDGNRKSSEEIISDDVDFGSYIPEEWLSLGKYKTVEDLIANAYYVLYSDVDLPDRLVIDYSNYEVTLRYKGRKVTIEDEAFIENMFK